MELFAHLDEIEEDGFLIKKIKGKSIGAIKIKGELKIYLNYCPHAGAPVCSGKIGGLIFSDKPAELSVDQTRKILSCPWHGWEFDLENGKSIIKGIARLASVKYTINNENFILINL